MWIPDDAFAYEMHASGSSLQVFSLQTRSLKSAILCLVVHKACSLAHLCGTASVCNECSTENGIPLLDMALLGKFIIGTFSTSP